MKNNIKKLPEIRSKTKTIEGCAKGCLAGVRILCFVVNNFYKDNR